MCKWVFAWVCSYFSSWKIIEVAWISSSFCFSNWAGSSLAFLDALEFSNHAGFAQQAFAFEYLQKEVMRAHYLVDATDYHRIQYHLLFLFLISSEFPIHIQLPTNYHLHPFYQLNQNPPFLFPHQYHLNHNFPY